jgi:hypothetical protein
MSNASGVTVYASNPVPPASSLSGSTFSTTTPAVSASAALASDSFYIRNRIRIWAAFGVTFAVIFLILFIVFLAMYLQEQSTLRGYTDPEKNGFVKDIKAQIGAGVSPSQWGVYQTITLPSNPNACASVCNGDMQCRAVQYTADTGVCQLIKGESISVASDPSEATIYTLFKNSADVPPTHSTSTTTTS